MPVLGKEVTTLAQPQAGHGPFRPRSCVEVAAFRDNLSLVEPGLVSTVRWQPDRDTIASRSWWPGIGVPEPSGSSGRATLAAGGFPGAGSEILPAGGRVNWPFAAFRSAWAKPRLTSVDADAADRRERH